MAAKKKAPMRRPMMPPMSGGIQAGGPPMAPSGPPGYKKGGTVKVKAKAKGKGKK